MKFVIPSTMTSEQTSPSPMLYKSVQHDLRGGGGGGGGTEQ